jgi:hypothetical protein
LGIAGLVISLQADDEDDGDGGVDAALSIGPGSLSLSGRF